MNSKFTSQYSAQYSATQEYSGSVYSGMQGWRGVEHMDIKSETEAGMRTCQSIHRLGSTGLPVA